MEIEDGSKVVRADAEEGSEEGLVRVSKIHGCPRGWKSHLFQVLHSLIASFSILCVQFPLFDLISQKKKINTFLKFQSNRALDLLLERSET